MDARVPWSFGALWHGLTDAEKALLVRDYLRSVSRAVAFKFDLPGPLSPTAQEAYREFGKLQGDARDAVVKIFEEDLRAKSLWMPNLESTGGKLAWLRNTAIPTEKAVLCASWLLEEVGESPLRITALRDFLTKKVGRPISNPAAEVSDLSLHQPPLVEYISRSKGRAGITYKLTAEGSIMARDIHDDFASADNEEPGSGT